MQPFAAVPICSQYTNTLQSLLSSPAWALRPLFRLCEKPGLPEILGPTGPMGLNFASLPTAFKGIFSNTRSGGSALVVSVNSCCTAIEPVWMQSKGKGRKRSIWYCRFREGHPLLGRSRSGVGIGIDIVRSESEFESLKFRALRSAGSDSKGGLDVNKKIDERIPTFSNYDNRLW